MCKLFCLLKIAPNFILKPILIAQKYDHTDRSYKMQEEVSHGNHRLGE